MLFLIIFTAAPGSILFLYTISIRNQIFLKLSETNTEEIVPCSRAGTFKLDRLRVSGLCMSWISGREATKKKIYFSSSIDCSFTNKTLAPAADVALKSITSVAPWTAGRDLQEDLV